MKVLIIDIETTGWFNSKGLIVEVAAVLLNLENGDKETIFHQIVKEKGFNEEHKKAWIFENSDLKFEKVMKKGEDLKKDELQELLNRYPAAAWNCAFDFEFLRDRGLNITELPCPMKSSTKFFSIKRSFGFKWPSVQEAWDSLFPKIEYIEKHRAADDALHEAIICFDLYARGIWNWIQ